MKNNKDLETFSTHYDIGAYIHSEIEYFEKDKLSFLVDVLGDEDTNPEEVTNDQISEHFWGDTYPAENHFEDFLYMLDEEFKEYVGEREVKVTGKNIGWRNLKGYKTFDLNETQDIFYQVAPECDLTYHIEKTAPERYSVRISHHDSPTGEFYDLELTPLPF